MPGGGGGGAIIPTGNQQNNNSNANSNYRPLSNGTNETQNMTNWQNNVNQAGNKFAAMLMSNAIYILVTVLAIAVLIISMNS